MSPVVGDLLAPVLSLATVHRVLVVACLILPPFVKNDFFRTGMVSEPAGKVAQEGKAYHVTHSHLPVQHTPPEVSSPAITTVTLNSSLTSSSSPVAQSTNGGTITAIQIPQIMTQPGAQTSWQTLLSSLSPV